MQYCCRCGCDTVVSEPGYASGHGPKSKYDQKPGQSLKDYYNRQCNDESYKRYSNDGLGPLFKDPNTGKSMYAEQFKQKYGYYPNQ